MYFQKPGRKSKKPGRNLESLEKFFKKPMSTLLKINLPLKIIKKRCTFKHLDEILKAWQKFRKSGKNYQKTYSHPVVVIIILH